MKVYKNSAILLVIGALLLFVSACTDSAPSGVVTTTGSGGVKMDFTAPSMLQASRAIDRTNLLLEVEVNGRKLSMDGVNNVWTGVTNVNRGDTLTIIATWSENYAGSALVLAEAKRTYTVPVNPDSDVIVQFVTGDYFTGFDQDQDGTTNLAERNLGTDPNAREQFADPVVFVPYGITAELPERLRIASGEVKNELFAVAEIDRLSLNLTRENERWIGESSFPTDADVLVSFTVYRTESREVPLARWQNSRNVGSGSSVYIGAGDYSYDSFNTDGDEVINVQEILDETNPLDKSDPAPNPCDTSFFTQGCRIDSDGDGDADSIETQAADSDGDSIPDYKESSNVDADDDGFNAEQDPDENNFCIPSEDSVKCQANKPADQDNDGVADEDDNCPALSNADQLDVDKDGVGDACKPVVVIKDQDNDGVADEVDNCPALSNADQLDLDGDGVGDACKPVVVIKDQDNDGVADEDDNCPALSNADQLDVDDDGVGDACKPVVVKPIVVIKDQDNDGVADEDDNCPELSNADQLDVDDDGVGDACKPVVVIEDQDEDGIEDDDDNCPSIANEDQDDEDKDGVGDACDVKEISDSDKDSIEDDEDNCPSKSNKDQADVNENGVGDACETSLLSYEFFEGKWTQLPNFNSLTAKSSGTAKTFTLPKTTGTNFYGYQFTGQLYVEEAGSYTFYLASNDGSKLYIDGKLVVDNDGLHTLVEEQATVSLKEGLHDISVDYFQYGGTKDLILSWASSDFSKRVIADDVLFAP